MFRNKSRHNHFHIPNLKRSGAYFVTIISLKLESNVPEHISSQSFPYQPNQLCQNKYHHNHFHIRNQMFRNKSRHNHFHITKLKCSGTNLSTIIYIKLESNVPEHISSQSFPYHKTQMFRNKSRHNHLQITNMK